MNRKEKASRPTNAELVRIALDFFKHKVNFCDGCGQMMIRDWDRKSEYACHNCQTLVSVANAASPPRAQG